jgi:hypothetical protein
MVLAFGTAIGLPGLIPMLATAATAALLFLFGAKLVGRWTAFIATALWLAAPHNITWRAAYFSESLTGLLWVAWSYFAWRYRITGRRRDLVITSLLVAFTGITRPVTAIALSVPLPFILWPRLREAAGRRSAMIAAGAGLVICAIVPIWCHAVLDSWTTVPYSVYSARTFPFDMPTFSSAKVNWAPPPRELPPDIQALADVQRIPYEQLSVDSLPSTFVHRADALARQAIPNKFWPVRYLAPVGLLAAGGAGIVALVSALILLLAHLSMPHNLGWTIYYLDVFPVVTFGLVIALRQALELVARYAPTLQAALRFRDLLALGAGFVLLGYAATAWRAPPIDDNGWMHSETVFRAGTCALPPGPKIVFVNPRPGSTPHHNLVDNDPRWQTSDAWIVRPWGAERNRALMAAAPTRAPYYFDEQAGVFDVMNRDGRPTLNVVVNVAHVDLRTGRGITCK